MAGPLGTDTGASSPVSSLSPSPSPSRKRSRSPSALSQNSYAYSGDEFDANNHDQDELDGQYGGFEAGQLQTAKCEWGGCTLEFWEVEPLVEHVHNGASRHEHPESLSLAGSSLSPDPVVADFSRRPLSQSTPSPSMTRPILPTSVAQPQATSATGEGAPGGARPKGASLPSSRT